MISKKLCHYVYVLAYYYFQVSDTSSAANGQQRAQIRTLPTAEIARAEFEHTKYIVRNLM